MGWGALWELDTATGQSYPELASEVPNPLNDKFTSFKVRLKKGIYWSDGVEFTADDLIYTLDAYKKLKDRSHMGRVALIANYVASYKKIDPYTVRIDTAEPAHDIVFGGT